MLGNGVAGMELQSGSFFLFFLFFFSMGKGSTAIGQVEVAEGVQKPTTEAMAK